MIKINLLNSVTDRQGSTVVKVEKKVSNPMTRVILMAVAVFVLTFAFIGLDVLSSWNEQAAAETALAEEKKKQKELEQMLKEQNDLEAKIKNIDLRLDAIKKLRNSQAGPSAVLEAIRERIGMTPNIYLDSVEQEGDKLTIIGSSPVESSVTQFGRSLEFSSGLFSNLSIETNRAEIEGQNKSDNATSKEIVKFTIRCAYTPEKANLGDDNQPMTASNIKSSSSTESNQSSETSEEQAKNEQKAEADKSETSEASKQDN